MANKIDDETIDYVGILAKLELSPEEKDGQKYAAVIYVVKYAEGEIKYTVGYDEDMKLVQFVAQ